MEKNPAENPMEARLKNFRAEVEILAGDDPHFAKLNPEELTEEDFRIYAEYRSGGLTVEKVNEYRNSMEFEDEGEPHTENSRALFAMWLANQVTKEDLKKQLEQYKKEK